MSELDREFVEHQRARLESLKVELQEMRGGLRDDQEYRAEEEGDLSQNDSGDMSHSLHTRQVDATVEAQIDQRLTQVDRALQKVEKGTYGLCDDTGEEISRKRLEFMPEATRTVEAQKEHHDGGAGRRSI
jgi:DnaK suppressor protein